MIGKTILHYKITEKLGEGGMGIVYKAEDTKLKRAVAIKFLPRQIAASEEERARFKIEAQAAAALNHPNIATIYAIEEHHEEMFIVMEYIEGRELREIIAEKSPEFLKLRGLLEFATQIAAGLQAAHKKGVTHRDIKSSNIMITDEGQVKIMDFGLAKVRGGAQFTKVGTTLGTAAYMSPEQALAANVDHRTDIWSFGIVLYEMLSGQLPFQGDYEQAILYAVINEQHAPLVDLPTSVPDKLRLLIDKCLEKEAAKRYQQIEEVLQDLEVLRDRGKSGSLTGKGVEREKARLNGKALVMVALAAVLILSRLWWILKPEAESQPASIAVLPFQNLSGDPAQEYFSDGMTETIISGLANISDLAVISRTSVMPYKNSEKNTRDIARELNVGHILEGSVLTSGEKVRIFAQLIDGKTDANLWAQTYDREMTDIFSIQSDVANQIAAVLQVVLGADARTRIAQRPTTDFEAYRFYLKGEFYFKKQTLTDIDTSIVLYEQAIERDSDFALAYAALASAYMWKNLVFDPNPQWEEQCYVAVQQALSLDPNLAEAYVVRGMLYWSPSNNFAHEEALKEYETAITLKPGLSSAYQQLSLVQRHIGLLDDALITGRKSVRLDPGNLRARRFVGQVLLDQGKYTEASAIFERLPETFAPPLTISLTALSLFYLQRLDDAVELIEQNLLKYPIDPQFNSSYAIILASLGRYDEALQRMDVAMKNVRAYTHIHHIYHNLAGASALMGRNEEAVKWLVKAAEAGLPCFPLFNRDPNLKILKSDPGFEAFMLELKGRWEYYKML